MKCLTGKEGNPLVQLFAGVAVTDRGMTDSFSSETCAGTVALPQSQHHTLPLRMLLSQLTCEKATAVLCCQKISLVKNFLVFFTPSLHFLQEDFDCLRSLCYPDTDVFLVCFSVVNPSSFQNITEKWIPEIRTHNPRAPVLLVGTQADLRDDVNVLISLDRYHVKPVPRPQAEGLADKIRAEAYLECSALTQKNLKEVFDMAIVSGVEHKARQEKKMTAKGIKTLSKCRWKKFFCFV